MPTYQPPVSRLLNFAKCEPFQHQNWPDYVGEFGFTEKHVPELLTLMQDRELIILNPEEDHPELDAALAPELAMWAPFHAWRALGQLRAVEFLEPAVAFLNEYDDIDWAWEEFPRVFELIGPPIIEPLGAAIKAEAVSDGAATTLISGLERIGETFPETRDRCVALLTETLQNYAANHIQVNSTLISHLVDLQATESVDVIEAAYQADKVDTFYAGTWANIQVELGLKTEADFTEEELAPELPPNLAKMREMYEAMEQMRKPDAFALGLPIDYSALPSSKPPEFGDMQSARSPNEAPHSNQGFGTAQKSSKKSKKKKKR